MLDKKSYIEYFGLPGSGKTTIINRLKHSLKINEFDYPVNYVQSNKRVVRNIIIIIKAIKGFKYKPIRVLHNKLFDSFSFFNIKSQLNFLWLCYEVSKPNLGKKNKVLSEGILQAWWGLYIRELVSEASINHIIKFIELNYGQIIILDCKLELIKERLTRRVGNSIIEKKNVNVDIMKKAHDGFNIILKNVGKSELSYNVIDSGGDINDSVKECYETIHRFITSSQKRG